MTTFSKDNKSNRLLQSRRYTIAAFDGQEAFSEVLDLNSSEIYIDQNLIPTSSLPYSGSSQDRLYVTASGGGKNILQYYYRLPLTPGNVTSPDGTRYQTWFALDPSGSTTNPQIIDGNQLVNFISNKYISPSLASNNAEGSTTGYNIVISKGNTSSSAAVENANFYQFDYKIGVVQYTASNVAPLLAEKLWLTAYRYVGDTLDTFVASGSGGGGTGAGFPFSGSAVITGSLLISGSGNINELVVSGNVVATQGFTGSLLGDVVGGINISAFIGNDNYFIPFVQSLGNGKSLYIDGDQTFTYNASTDTLKIGSLVGGIPTGSIQLTGSINMLSGSITLNSGSFIGTSSRAVSASEAVNSALVSVTTSSALTSFHPLTFILTQTTGTGNPLHIDPAPTVTDPLPLAYQPSTNTLRVSGSIVLTGSMTVIGGSIIGTSSQAVSASIAQNISPTLFTIPQPNVGDMITGSGIVISASSLPTNTFNAIKIGNTELYDNFGSPGRFYINVPNSLYILSGSVSTGSIALLSQNSFDFYERWEVSNAEKNFSSDKDEFIIYKSQSNNDVATTAFRVNRQTGLLYASGGASISGSANIQNNLAVGSTLTAGTSTLSSLTVTNNTTLDGNLVVMGTASFLGSASFINVDNLLIEDKFILLNSGSTGAVPHEGGIIVQTTSSAGVAAGAALFYEQTTNRWMVARSSSVNFNATSITVGATTDYIVTVSASAGDPVSGSTPVNFGLGNDNVSVGQMYINTSNGNIYIYA
jgi:hypothetical protein